MQKIFCIKEIIFLITILYICWEFSKNLEIMKNYSFFFNFIALIIITVCFNTKEIKAENTHFDFEVGKKLFLLNCNVCHINGSNIIIPEKNLKKETLERNGIYNLNAIVYQIINGKNGMPAFGGRLEESQIEEIAKYILSSEI